MRCFFPVVFFFSRDVMKYNPINSMRFSFSRSVRKGAFFYY